MKHLIDRAILIPAGEGRFAAGTKAHEVAPLDDQRPTSFGDVEILRERQVHSGNMADFAPSVAICPRCDEILEEYDPIMDACVAWQEGNDEAPLTCPECGASSRVADWDFDGDGGLGNLAFRFWEWPMFSQDFVDEISRLLDHEIVEVDGKL